MRKNACYYKHINKLWQEILKKGFKVLKKINVPGTF